MSVQSLPAEEPEFISFLFSTKLKYDCFFLVGNKDQMEPEKIGVVKAMLMAHSVVLRLELEDSELAEKGQVAVPDIYPDTFRSLLRYVYGHDTTAGLCFDEADNLFYVAEKYMMGTLKKKLATRLMSLLNTENICSLLNNPAYYTELELNSAITEILRYETDSVLASPLFLGLSPDGFIKILEQDGLSVPEIELWRATMKWAKHNAGSEEGVELRNRMSKVTKYIRICTLSAEQFCLEVAPSRVLCDKEGMSVCIAIGKQEKQDELTEICNEIKPRDLLSKKKQFDLQFDNHTNISHHTLRDFSFTVVTKKSVVELLPLECPQTTTEDAGYEVGCTTTVTRMTDNVNNSSTETPVIVRFNKQVDYRKKFEIPLISNGRNVTLLPNSKYTIRMLFDCDQGMYIEFDSYKGCYENNHLSLHNTLLKSPGGNFHYLPVNHLAYLTDAE